MKRISVFLLLFVILFSAAISADEETGTSLSTDKENQAMALAQEVLAGRQVRVRVYNDWKKDPRAYKLVSVELDGLSFQCDAVTKAFGQMSESAVIVVAGQDQTDEAVALVIDNFVYAELYEYKKGGSFHIWPGSYTNSKYAWWIFEDADLNPILKVEVEIFIGSDRYSVNNTRVWFGNAALDEKGRLKPLILVSKLREFSFFVHHPDCGKVSARDDPVFYPDESCLKYIVPTLPKDKWCVFTDALGGPIPNATVEIFAGSGWEVGQSKQLAKIQLDEKGRLKPPESNVLLEMCHFILSHPDYGIALIDPTWKGRPGRLLENCTAPLVRVGVKADERTIWGAVVDPNQTPVADALIGCSRVIAQGRGLIDVPDYNRYRTITDKDGRFAMYLPIEQDGDNQSNLVPLASKYFIEINAPKSLRLQRFMGEINSGEESIITMFPDGYDGYFHTFAFEDKFSPISDPNQLRKIELSVSQEKGMQSFGHDSWKDGGKFPLGTYTARVIRDESLKFGTIQVTEDSPELLVFKTVADDRIVYKGRVVHGLTGEPIPDAVVMKRPTLSDAITSNLELEHVEAIFSIGPEFDPDDFIFELLKDGFKSTMITRTNSGGDFHIALPKKEDEYPGDLIAAKKDYLGAQQQLRYMAPIDEKSPESMRFREFEPNENGYVNLPVMKLFPAGTVIVEPNISEYNPMEKYEIRFHWRPSPEDNTPWLKELWITPRESGGGSIFYKQKLRPNHIQSVYIVASVELTLKIFPMYDNQLAPVVIHGVKLRQGQILDLGSIDFGPAFKVAIKVVDSSNEPVEGVAVSCLDEFDLFMGQKAITNESGIVMLYVPPHSRGKFIVSYYDETTRNNIQEGIFFKTAGQEDAGKQFTLRISDEILELLFKSDGL
jgi:protocatechuate 3,4-dioxygenase beta subunit